MTFQTLTFQRKEYVGIIHINCHLDDEEKMYRLSDDLFELRKEITLDREIKVIILTGLGEKIFSKGINSVELVFWINNGCGLETEFKPLAETIAKLDQPVIAAIGADAIGQGLELALACDIRIASDTSHFGLPHIKRRFIPWDGGTQRLPRLVGKGKALEMILTGEVIDAQEALRIGLVHKIVPKKDLTEVTMKLAQEVASKGPIALRYTKEAVYKGMDMTLEQGLHLEADLYLLLHTSNDRTEGIHAFREKRTPRFEGK